MELEKCLPRSSDPISDSNDYSPHEGIDCISSVIDLLESSN